MAAAVRPADRFRRAGADRARPRSPARALPPRGAAAAPRRGDAGRGRPRATGIRAETQRYLRSHPWLAARDPRAGGRGGGGTGARSAPGDRRDRAGRSSRERRARASSGPAPRAAAVGHDRRHDDAAQATHRAGRRAFVGRGRRTSSSGRSGSAPAPIPRSDYAELEEVTLPGAATSLEVELDDVPRRIQLAGSARGNRTVQRATVSALTSGNSGAQWRRQASAS